MANNHDFEIANQTGADFRSDLNTLLLQIKATNAGSDAPSSTAEGMLWYESDADVLHVYDGSAWKPLLKFVATGSAQALGTGDQVTHSNLSAITGTVQGLGQGNTPTFAGMTIADGSNDLNIASHDGSNGLKLGGTLVTSSATELNLLDGVTDLCTQTELDARVSSASTAAQGVGTGDAPTFNGATFNGSVSIADGTTNLNIISHDGSTGGLKLESVLVTSTANELNILDGCTATTTELNLMDGCTASTTELNTMNGITASTAELNLMDGVTSTTAELNILDGVTSTATELNILDGVTSTTAELNILDGVTSTTAELNILDGVTSTATELNLLDGVTATTTELNYLDVTTLGTAQASKALTADASGHVSMNDKNITNVGDVALDSLTADGTDIALNSDLVTSTTKKIKQRGAFLQSSTHQSYFMCR